jgi:trehalose 6-phosphate synthase/phosphatase
VERPDGLQFEQSMGGLVSGLSSYLDSLGARPGSDIEYVWMGWPGITVAETAQAEVASELERRFQASPVFIAAEDMENFYHGFCNKTIWPLFHYFPERAVFDESSWESYKRVNRLFCEAVLERMKPDDIVWIHDYHLMLLPKLLREKAPKQQIGFFSTFRFPRMSSFACSPAIGPGKSWKGF